MYQTLSLDKREGIAYLCITREEALNALNMETLKELNQAFTQVAEDPEVKVVLLTGEGKAFVAGADIASMSSMTPAQGRELAREGHKLMNFIERLEKPVIALVNGFALGGGCELAMACDLRIASVRAKFGQPEVNLGITPGFGGTIRLPKLVGRAKAKHMIMTGKIISAEEAYAIGLCDELIEAEELLARGEELAKEIMKKAPMAVAIAKTLINNAFDLDTEAGSKMEIEGFTSSFGTEDKQEGMEAFLNKRNPIFKGK